MAAATVAEEVIIRPGTQDDAERAAEVCMTSFNNFNETVSLKNEFNFPPVGLFQTLFDSATIDKNIGYVAVKDGEIIGSNGLHFSDGMATIGPISVQAGKSQDRGVGRKLMQAVVDEARRRGYDKIGLAQVGSNIKSFSLYSKMGFAPTGINAFLHGCLKGYTPPATSYEVRMAEMADAEECGRLSESLGVKRLENIRWSFGDLNRYGCPLPCYVCVDTANDDEIVGYTAGFAYESHSCAKDELAIKLMYHRATEDYLTRATETEYEYPKAIEGGPPELNIPFVHHPGLNRFFLDHGLRLWHLVTQMWIGDYKVDHTQGVFLPSIGGT